ncbi:MAG: hypothetical protein ACKV2U_06810 [Bryobacteraceae bacterium]
MTEPIWIEEPSALAIHDRLLTLYGGAAGIRDANLLGEAVSEMVSEALRPRDKTEGTRNGGPLPAGSKA